MRRSSCAGAHPGRPRDQKVLVLGAEHGELIVAKLACRAVLLEDHDGVAKVARERVVGHAAEEPDREDLLVERSTWMLAHALGAIVPYLTAEYPTLSPRAPRSRHLVRGHPLHIPQARPSIPIAAEPAQVAHMPGCRFSGVNHARVMLSIECRASCLCE